MARSSVCGIFEPMPSPSAHPQIQLGPRSFDVLQLPPFALQWRVQGPEQTLQVKCLSRKKFVALEPEEWVRQHWVHYLSSELGYPLGRIAVEQPLQLNGLARFADIVCHDNAGIPLLLVEVKRPNIALSASVLNQVLRYHLTLQTPLVIISNGIQHQAYHVQGGQFKSLDRLPPGPSSTVSNK